MVHCLHRHPQSTGTNILYEHSSSLNITSISISVVDRLLMLGLYPPIWIFTNYKRKFSYLWLQIPYKTQNFTNFWLLTLFLCIRDKILQVYTIFFLNQIIRANHENHNQIIISICQTENSYYPKAPIIMSTKFAPNFSIL